MISTDTNPLAVQSALDAVQKELQQEEEEASLETPPTRYPTDGTVQLVGGLLEPEGIIDTAVVRELNGRDEEAITKAASNPAKAMIVILNRGVESIGGNPASPEDLDALLAADRDLLLLKIREVTFGSELEFHMACPFCGGETDAVLDLSKDVPITYLDDPVRDRTFTVKLRNGEALVRLPTGITQKNLAAAAATKTVAELNTLMLYGCVKQINGRDVLDQSQVLNLGIADRNAIMIELDKRIPGPQWNQVKKECPSCGEEVPIPLSADTLFRV